MPFPGAAPAGSSFFSSSPYPTFCLFALGYLGALSFFTFSAFSALLAPLEAFSTDLDLLLLAEELAGLFFPTTFSGAPSADFFEALLADFGAT